MVRPQNYLTTGRSVIGVKTRIPYRLHKKQLSRYKPSAPVYQRRTPITGWTPLKAAHKRKALDDERQRLAKRAREGPVDMAEAINNDVGGAGGVPVAGRVNVVNHHYAPGMYKDDPQFLEISRFLPEGDIPYYERAYHASITAPRKKTGFTWPGTRYLGPRNELHVGPPVDIGDARALIHDHFYDRLMKESGAELPVYLTYNAADELSWKQMMAKPVSKWTTNEWILSAFLGGKKIWSKTPVGRAVRSGVS